MICLLLYDPFKFGTVTYINHNNLLTHFWNRWRSEYVPSLREYQKVYCRTNNIKPSIGDIVHIHEDRQPQQKWLLGYITELMKRKDNVWGAVIFLGRTKRNIERPINKLYPIIEFHDDEIENNNVNRDTLCPRCGAAIMANLKPKFCCWRTWYMLKIVLS